MRKSETTKQIMQCTKYYFYYCFFLIKLKNINKIFNKHFHD